MTYKFKNIENLESFLIDKSLGIDLLVPSGEENCLAFFHNGDKMMVNTKTGKLEWDPLNPGEAFSSKLSLRFHEWFSKGFIELI